MAVPTFRSYALLHCFEPLRIRGATPARQSCRKAGSKKTPQRGIVGGAPGGDKCVRNVWCCSASIGKKLALLNVVATAVNREPDKNENTLNEAVTLYLPKSACLVLYKLLTKSYKHWRKSNPDNSSPNPMRLDAKEYAERRAVWQLEGALERAVPELFASDSVALLKESKRLLVGR